MAALPATGKPPCPPPARLHPVPGRFFACAARWKMCLLTHLAVVNLRVPAWIIYRAVYLLQKAEQ